MKWDGPFFVKFFLEMPERLYQLQPISRGLGESVVDVDHPTGTARVKFHLDENHCNYNKRVHGGVIALLLDEVTGVAAFAHVGDRFKATVECKVTYLRSLRPGEIFAEARAVHSTPTILFMEAAVMDGESKQIARSSSTIALTAKEQA
jgi:acyl-CoA thioesterase